MLVRKTKAIKGQTFFGMLGFCNLFFAADANKNKMQEPSILTNVWTIWFCQGFNYKYFSYGMCSATAFDQIFRLGLMDMKLKWVNVV